MIVVAIREAAEKRGITTAYQLQKALNVAPSMAAKWWSNKLQMIGMDTLDRLCIALEVTPNDLLVFAPNEKKQKTR